MYKREGTSRRLAPCLGVEYLHQNPVRAGIVKNAEDYIYSSARNYAELDTLLEIELLDLPVITVK